MSIKPWVAISLSLAATTASADAAITRIVQPDADYIADTTLLPLSGPDFTIVNSLTAGGTTLTFSGPTNIRTFPTPFATWGLPPNVEGPDLRVLFTQGQQSLTFTSNTDLSIFGIEVAPNDLLRFTEFEAEFYLDGVQIGNFFELALLPGEARLLAARGRFDSVRVIFDNADFYFGRVRIAAADTPTVPAPAAVLLLTTGLGFLSIVRRRSGA